MSLPKYTRNSDGTYGPTSQNHFYISKPDHRRTATPKKGKTRWSIEEGQEFYVFKVANEPYWFCIENNCLFGFIFEDEGLIILGENDEVLAKFPNDRNENEPWHGYPVNTEEPENRPSSELLDVLEQNNEISFEYRIKIEKGRI